MYLLSVLEQFNLFYIPLFYFFKVFFSISNGVSFLINSFFVNFLLSFIFVNDVIGREIFFELFLEENIIFIIMTKDLLLMFISYFCFDFDFDFFSKTLTFGYINNMIFGYLVFFFIKNIIFFGNYKFTLFINKVSNFIRLKFLLKFQEMVKTNFGSHYPFFTKSLVFYPYFLTIFLVIFFSNFQGLIFADLHILLF